MHVKFEHFWTYNLGVMKGKAKYDSISSVPQTIIEIYLGITIRICKEAWSPAPPNQCWSIVRELNELKGVSTLKDGGGGRVN